MPLWIALGVKSSTSDAACVTLLARVALVRVEGRVRAGDFDAEDRRDRKGRDDQRRGPARSGQSHYFLCFFNGVIFSLAGHAEACQAHPWCRPAAMP